MRDTGQPFGRAREKSVLKGVGFAADRTDMTSAAGSMQQKQLVYVLGMHRSGTSLITRILALCGLALPERLMGATRGNPTGHWEPLDAYLLNESFLTRKGSTWFDPSLRLQCEDAVGARERDAFIGEIRAFLDCCPNDAPLLIKEPRISVLTEYWFAAALQSGYAIKVVIANRHPGEVIGSLRTRDEFSAELASAVWLKYTLLAERAARAVPRVVVCYENVLADWRKEIGRIAAGLDIDLSLEREAEIDAFLDVSLHHEKSERSPDELFGVPLMAPTYAALVAAGRGEPLVTAALDEAFATFRAGERAFRSGAEEARRRAGGAMAERVAASPLTLSPAPSLAGLVAHEPQVVLDFEAGEERFRAGAFVVSGGRRLDDLATIDGALEGRPVDTVVLGDILETVDEPITFLRELRRLLAPNAQLLARVSNGRNLWALNELVEGRPAVPGRRGFSFLDLGSIFASAGYRLETVDGHVDARLKGLPGDFAGVANLKVGRMALDLSAAEIREMSVLAFLVRARPVF